MTEKIEATETIGNFQDTLSALLQEFMEKATPETQQMVVDHVDRLVVIAGAGEIKIGFKEDNGMLRELAHIQTIGMVV